MPKAKGREVYCKLSEKHAILWDEIHAMLSPDRSLSTHEFLAYMLEWIDVRRKEPGGCLWVPPTPRKKWKGYELDILGTKSDKAIGLQLGRSEWSVTQKRIDLGIPQWKESDA